MKEYTVTGRSISLHSGLVKLTDAQAGIRLHRLQKTDEPGIYEILEPIELKNGEVFSTDHVLGKVVLSNVETQDPDIISKGAVLLKDLAAAVKLNIRDIGKLLKEKYATSVPNNGQHELPQELAEKVAADLNATLEPAAETDDTDDETDTDDSLPPAGSELAPPLQ